MTNPWAGRLESDISLDKQKSDDLRFLVDTEIPELKFVSENRALLEKALTPFLERRRGSLIELLSNPTLGLEQVRFAQGAVSSIAGIVSYIRDVDKHIGELLERAKVLKEEIDARES